MTKQFQTIEQSTTHAVLTVDQLCIVLGISRSTYDRWRKTSGALPRSYKIGNKRLFPIEEVNAWKANNLA